MFSLDDRAGNVVTTVALFTVAAAILYLARGAFLILLLSLLFAYLIEPAVTWVQNHSPLGRKNRTWAIAQVYLLGALLLGSLGFTFGPRLVAQLKNLSRAIPGILEGISSGRAVADLENVHGLSAAQQLKIQDELARHQDVIARVVEQGAKFAAYVAASAIWLFVIIILAIFILRDGHQIADAILKALEGGETKHASSESFSKWTRCLQSTCARSSPWRVSRSSSIASQCWSWDSHMRSRWAFWEAFWNSFQRWDGLLRPQLF